MYNQSAIFNIRLFSMNDRMNNQIAIVDDDIEILDVLSKKLAEYGYKPQIFTCGEDLIKTIKAGNIYSLILLDINLSDNEDGISICRKIKCMVDIPIIFVSAYSSVLDKVVGLEVGADDYITKPYDFRELLARIKLILRRTKESTIGYGGIYETETWKLDLSKRIIIYSGKSFTKLTSGLYDLLVFLINHKETIINREALYQHLFQEKFQSYDRRLDVRISQLRKILDQDLYNKTYIETIKGIGYKLVESPIVIQK